MSGKWERYKWNSYIGIILVFSTLLVGCVIGIAMSEVETPNYQVKSSFEGVEIREYPSMVVALVSVEGDRKQSVGHGFRILADYIFGNNRSEEKIAMTAPVQQQSFEKRWQVRFVMPSTYAIENLPKPRNSQIKIEEIAPHQCIAIRFSGASSDKNIEKNQKKLIDYIRKNQIQSVGSPTYAFYDPPWIPSFMRRNEIMFVINQ